ncbi:DUF1684 domain-containing protein [Microbacterium horticulturae]|uniref:DUF1684 domain-containing protein n=1 Tax=Microbacterium horticulturae TaxID=3028316 RepID=A0ABY8C0W4_9MICO|nr:DUF1684 domain-containing protein [Microbacterium sp. KACC 23027]WEG08880.1 DUF1684 domain-containing protein [Microbacterium sp. KACC 23027]
MTDRDAADFVAAWESWHVAHEQERADPHGFLAITAAHWLTPEPQRFDDVPGAWSAGAEGAVVVLADGEALAVDGVPIIGRHTFVGVAPGAPARATWSTAGGGAVVEVADFGGHAVLRPRHPDNPTLVTYAGTPAYAPDERFVVDALFTPFATPREVAVDTVVDGLETVFDAAGTVEFELDGPHRLTAFSDDDGLRLLFTDRTSGVTTYAASRNLHIPAPDAAGHVRIDFNRATNLPCAYTSSAMCPLPPVENRLDVAVEAGEKIPG